MKFYDNASGSKKSHSGFIISFTKKLDYNKKDKYKIDLYPQLSVRIPSVLSVLLVTNLKNEIIQVEVLNGVLKQKYDKINAHTKIYTVINNLYGYKNLIVIFFIAINNLRK